MVCEGEKKNTYIIASSESLFIASKNPIDTFVLFFQIRYIISYESKGASIWMDIILGFFLP